MSTGRKFEKGRTLVPILHDSQIKIKKKTVNNQSFFFQKILPQASESTKHKHRATDSK